MTDPNLSREPMGTEGELTDGPDDENPFENLTDGYTDTKGRDDDPFMFDDMQGALEGVRLPEFEGPRF